MKYNEKLRDLRKKLGYTQIQMAEVLAIKQVSVSKYEVGATYPCGFVRKKYLQLAKKIKYPLTIEELLRD